MRDVDIAPRIHRWIEGVPTGEIGVTSWPRSDTFSRPKSHFLRVHNSWCISMNHPVRRISYYVVRVHKAAVSRRPVITFCNIRWNVSSSFFGRKHKTRNSVWNLKCRISSLPCPTGSPNIRFSGWVFRRPWRLWSELLFIRTINDNLWHKLILSVN